MTKCPDCGGSQLERLPCFTHPKFKRKYLSQKLREIQQAARASSNLPNTDPGYNRIIPPELIVKKGKRSGWTREWVWSLVSGPAWMGLAKDDPHRCKQDSRALPFGGHSVIVPGMFPGRLNIAEPKIIVAPADLVVSRLQEK